MDITPLAQNRLSQVDVLKQALGAISGGRVLDVATGEGAFIVTLLGNLKSYAQIIGIDMLEYSEAAGSIFRADKVCFCQMDATRLGFEDERFTTWRTSRDVLPR